MATPVLTRNKIKEVAQKVAETFHPDKIILFGSWAWGTPGPDSDVDLFVIKQTENTRATAREIDAYLFPRPFPIDIVVNRPQDVEKRLMEGDFFINDVIFRGIVLCSK